MMALSNPSPSPLNAGPKHSGRRIRSRITRLAFSSTLSPINTIYYLHNLFHILYVNER
jgi:hypothetical protein